MQPIPKYFFVWKSEQLNQTWEAVKCLHVTGRSFLTCGGPGFVSANRPEYKACLKEVLSQYKQMLQEWEKDRDSDVKTRIEAVEYWIY